jgi:hypothetical protein
MSVVIVALVAVVIFVAAATVIAWPLVRGERIPDEVVTDAEQHRRQVDDDLQRTLAAIKEIEFDHASGHLSDEDFSTLDTDERTKAIQLLRERDGIAGEGAQPGGGPA